MSNPGVVKIDEARELFLNVNYSRKVVEILCIALQTNSLVYMSLIYDSYNTVLWLFTFFNLHIFLQRNE